MSDIIQHAKDLLEGADPNPWIVSRRSFGVIDAIGPIERDPTEGLDVDSGSAELAAASLEMAQAIAEETWEYSFQIRYADGWETACDDVTELDQWWPDKSEAEEAAASAYDPYIDRPIRLIRRRVSPVEVINE